MNPKGLATTRRMKKGGRAAVIPLGEVNQPAAPLVGAEQGVLDRQPKAEVTAKSPHLKAITCIRYLPNSKSDFLAPPIIPPGGQRIPPGRPRGRIKFALLSIKICRGA